MEARVSPKVVKWVRRLWLVASVVVFLAAAYWASATVPVIAWSVVVVGGWSLTRYLERPPGRWWIVDALIVVPFLAGVFAGFYLPNPARAVCWGLALAVWVGGYMWPWLRRRRAAQRMRVISDVPLEPRASPEVIRLVRWSWFVASVIVVLIALRTSGVTSDLAWLFAPFVVLGGWSLSLHLQRAPRLTWILEGSILVALLASFSMSYPANFVCLGFALVVYLVFAVWPWSEAVEPSQEE